MNPNKRKGSPLSKMASAADDTKVPKTHKACVYDKVGSCSIAIRDVETPEPGPGEVLVQLTHSGVCHSDYGIMMNTVSLQPRTHRRTNRLLTRAYVPVSGHICQHLQQKARWAVTKEWDSWRSWAMARNVPASKWATE